MEKPNVSNDLNNIKKNLPHHLLPVKSFLKKLKSNLCLFCLIEVIEPPKKKKKKTSISKG